MTQGGIQFGDFTLDAANRRLSRDGAPVELSSRYFDALALLVAERGRLVSKDRFMDEVWRGVPVTDEALTQCVKTLRRQLGDNASSPRFIETVPKHGYRFIAPVGEGSVEPARSPAAPSPSRDALLIGGAGLVGSGMAGLIGGLFYGFAGASQPLAPGMGAVSVLLVLMSLTILVALAGGAGVSAGIAAAHGWKRDRWWASVGLATFGGMAVGAIVKLLGLDAFNLLFGRAPAAITGGPEGAIIGAAVGLAAWLALRPDQPRHFRRYVVIAAALGAGAGLLITAIGWHLLGGSLDLLAREFDGSRLELARIGALVGERGFGPVARYVTAALEGALFGAFLVGAMIIARRQIDSER